MAISERDLKLLWGRAAGRCSICKIGVTEDKKSTAESYPFGENAHIVAEKPNGPRGDLSVPVSFLNNYLNLILLCPTCHTKIDKAPEDFPVSTLQFLKAEHESEMDRQHPPDKASYDELLGFSRVTSENWLSPDRKDYVPFGIRERQWAAAFLEPQLSSTVPRQIVRLFEIARACMMYGWFFYPLTTLGFEQLTRVAEFAVCERARTTVREPSDFETNLQTLISAEIILPTEKPCWQALGSLCEGRSRPRSVMLLDPGQALDWLRTTTDLVNKLFQPTN